MRRWLVTLAAALLAAVSAGAAPPRAPLTEAEAQAAVREVLPTLQAVRGLALLRPVPVRVVDAAAARAYIERRVRSFVPESELRAQQRAFELLGLRPAGTDLLAGYLDVVGEQAGGYYSPEDKAFYLLDGMPAGLAAALAAHELTHAIEDQHYDLDRRLAEAKQDDDLAFARSAVHEGTATLVMGIYLRRALGSGTLTREGLQSLAAGEAGKAEKLSRAPALIRRQLLGPYVLGPAFLLAGGRPPDDEFPAAAAERVYRDGPVSSEQILHPEKFWDPARRDRPRKIVVPDLGPGLPGGWRREADGVLGEITLGLLVGAPTPASMEAASDPASWSNEASAGWGGDRWELWSRGPASFVALVTEWDGERDASEFASALPVRRGLAWRREGLRVAVLAGQPPEAAALLARLVATAAPAQRTGLPPGP